MLNTITHLRFIIALLIGTAVAAFFGFLIGIPVLRLRGDYLAIVTLAFGEIIKNVISLNFVILMPTDSAAIRLSRIAMMARPLLELTRLNTTNNATRIKITPIKKVDCLGVPVIPFAPSIIISPVPDILRDLLSLIAMMLFNWAPAAITWRQTHSLKNLFAKKTKEVQ